MSQTDEPSAVKKAVRTVTPSYFGREDREMDAIGWMILVGLVVLFVPLLPVLVVVWVLTKVLEAIDPQTE